MFRCRDSKNISRGWISCSYLMVLLLRRQLPIVLKGVIGCQIRLLLIVRLIGLINLWRSSKVIRILIMAHLIRIGCLVFHLQIGELGLRCLKEIMWMINFRICHLIGHSKLREKIARCLLIYKLFNSIRN